MVLCFKDRTFKSAGKEPTVDAEHRRKIEEEFACISQRLDSPEGRIEAEAQVREELSAAREEHRRFLAKSRERGCSRVVYR